MLLSHGALAAISLLGSWRFEPYQLLPIALVSLLYAKRARTLRRRRTPVPRWRTWVFWLGIALLVLALASPIDAFAEQEFLFAHMLQHVLLGDLAPLCFVVGLTGPVLQPVLRFRWVNQLRVLTHPFIALPLWALDLGGWHVPYLYEAALHHDTVHALEHLCFFTFGGLMWAPVVETLPGPEWFGTGFKLGYIASVRLFETALGNVFLWSGTIFYPFYVHAHPRWGIGALHDQVLAGTVMMIEGSLVTIAALVWLFLRLAAEGELRQELLERGLDPRTVRRAVRYGRGQELSGSR
ncbi:MAG TPA: cytochrome c oxidase assembly protein [Gaiellaceae bacterium]